MRIFIRPHVLFLVVAAGEGARSAEALARYAVMDDFVAEAAPALHTLAVLGPQAAARLDARGLPPSTLAARPPWSHADAGPYWLAHVTHLGAAGFWFVGCVSVVWVLVVSQVAAGTLLFFSVVV